MVFAATVVPRHFTILISPNAPCKEISHEVKIPALYVAHRSYTQKGRLGPQIPRIPFFMIEQYSATCKYSGVDRSVKMEFKNP